MGERPADAGWGWVGRKSEEQKQQDCLMFPTTVIMISMWQALLGCRALRQGVDML